MLILSFVHDANEQWRTAVTADSIASMTQSAKDGASYLIVHSQQELSQSRCHSRRGRQVLLQPWEQLEPKALLAVCCAWPQQL